jgi:hypothetical protein
MVTVAVKSRSRMTTEMCLSVPECHAPAEPLTSAQKETLQRAVSKIVALGAEVGLSANQMIQLLQSGLTVGELLEYLGARSRDVA